MGSLTKFQYSMRLAPWTKGQCFIGDALACEAVLTLAMARAARLTLTLALESALLSTIEPESAYIAFNLEPDFFELAPGPYTMGS